MERISFSCIVRTRSCIPSRIQPSWVLTRQSVLVGKLMIHLGPKRSSLSVTNISPMRTWLFLQAGHRHRSWQEIAP